MNVVPIQQEIDLGQPKFEDFWLLWLKKAARKDAEKEFNRLKDSDKMLALIGAAEWRSVWSGWEQEFWPNAVKWIRGARWEDELPKEFRKTQAHELFKPKPEDNMKYVPMPDHVKALLNKLRGK
jgi:hypothetical protein